MKLARLWTEGEEVTAIEHQGSLYRVDRLDEVLGAPLPRGLSEQGVSFRRRVFSMAMVGLPEHAFELDDGTQLDDCALVEPPDGWLPPCGDDPALFELRPGATLPLRLEGRALLGHLARGVAPAGDAALRVSAAVALLLTDELRLPSEHEAQRAIGAWSLALAWSCPQTEALARAQGLGPAPGREPGTHLGPWMCTRLPDPGLIALQLACERGPSLITEATLSARVAEALERIGRHAELRAGDVLLIVAPGHLDVSPGDWVSVAQPGLGELRGRIGLVLAAPLEDKDQVVTTLRARRSVGLADQTRGLLLVFVGLLEGLLVRFDVLGLHLRRILSVGPGTSPEANGAAHVPVSPACGVLIHGATFLPKPPDPSHKNDRCR